MISSAKLVAVLTLFLAAASAAADELRYVVTGVGDPLKSNVLAHVETVGHWNTYEITARGGFLEARVNGTVTAVLEDADPTRGFIALQRWEQGSVRFRNLELKPI